MNNNQGPEPIRDGVGQKQPRKRRLTAARKEQNRLAQRAYRQRQKQQERAPKLSVAPGRRRLEPRQDKTEALGGSNFSPDPGARAQTAHSASLLSTERNDLMKPTASLQRTTPNQPSPFFAALTVSAVSSPSSTAATPSDDEPSENLQRLIDVALGLRSGLEDNATAVLRACLSNAICLGINVTELMHCERPCMSPFYRSMASMNEAPMAFAAGASYHSLPTSLRPTPAQILIPHHASLDLIPLPRLRERAILTCAALPHVFCLWEMKLDIYTRNALVCQGCDVSDESTSWSWDMRRWRAAPWFASKWKLVVDTDEVGTDLSMPGIPGLWT